MADILNGFVKSIESSCGQELVSVVLYGSKVTGEDTGKRSDYNLLVVLREAGPDRLFLLRPAVSRWCAAGNPPPVVFSLEMLTASADVFPMEFHDMKESRKVLYGEDPFSCLEIRDTHLRHQCEYELKSKLLALRREYLRYPGMPKELGSAAVASVVPVLSVFRHVLRLFGRTPPVKKEEALSDLSGIVGFDPGPFHEIMKMRKGSAPGGRSGAAELFEQYMSGIEQVTRAVDRL